MYNISATIFCSKNANIFVFVKAPFWAVVVVAMALVVIPVLVDFPLVLMVVTVIDFSPVVLVVLTVSGQEAVTAALAVRLLPSRLLDLWPNVLRTKPKQWCKVPLQTSFSYLGLLLSRKRNVVFHSTRPSLNWFLLDWFNSFFPFSQVDYSWYQLYDFISERCMQRRNQSDNWGGGEVLIYLCSSKVNIHILYISILFRK